MGSVGRKQYGSVRSVYLRSDMVGSHCPQSLSESLSESSISPVDRVGHRSERFEDESTYRDQSIYPNIWYIRIHGVVSRARMGHLV